jgi:peptidyl-Lys metalloendopeptidase
VLAATNSFVSCSNTRQSQLATARNSAVTYATNAKSYLDAGTHGSRYTWWFGTYTSSRYSTVRTHFTNLKSALSSQPYTFDCTCTDRNTYAYVYPTQPYRVYLCGAFWSAPNTGTDSRAGTLVHETSHFNVVAGTDDWAYGQTAAHNLANSNPSRAIDNADSHEYFAENNPARN